MLDGFVDQALSENRKITKKLSELAKIEELLLFITPHDSCFTLDENLNIAT